MSFDTIQLETARVLRDNLDLRTLDKREEVWHKVKTTHQNVKFSTVSRCIRKLQNQLGMYQPDIEDKRYIYTYNYKDFFAEMRKKSCSD